MKELPTLSGAREAVRNDFSQYVRGVACSFLSLDPEIEPHGSDIIVTVSKSVRRGGDDAYTAGTTITYFFYAAMKQDANGMPDLDNVQSIACKVAIQSPSQEQGAFVLEIARQRDNDWEVLFAPGASDYTRRSTANKLLPEVHRLKRSHLDVLEKITTRFITAAETKSPLSPFVLFSLPVRERERQPTASRRVTLALTAITGVGMCLFAGKKIYNRYQERNN